MDKQRLQLGLSSLHCWIRFYEWMLNLSYKLKLCKWQARGSEDKEKVQSEKKIIQDEFKTKLGILVDKPKHGYGSTNDGNSARRFFENYEISADITGLNKTLIYRSWIIRDAIAPIGLLSEYAQESKNKAIKTYRHGYTRKFSREQTMEDLFHQLLVSSDPYITSMRKLPQKKSRTYPEDVMMLLKEPAVE
ncbi:hypothetical protein JTB14_009140 [Gonioctena quinquepunctata]|nr:hypothetical protein JTB14_009140 [Gonioctena quinquepunctata]